MCTLSMCHVRNNQMASQRVFSATHIEAIFLPCAVLDGTALVACYCGLAVESYDGQKIQREET